MEKFVAAIENLYADYEVRDVRFMMSGGATLNGSVSDIDDMFAAAVTGSVEVSANDLVAA